MAQHRKGGDHGRDIVVAPFGGRLPQEGTPPGDGGRYDQPERPERDRELPGDPPKGSEQSPGPNQYRKPLFRHRAGSAGDRALPTRACHRSAQRERQNRHGRLLPAERESRQGDRGVEEGDLHGPQTLAVPIQLGGHPDPRQERHRWGRQGMGGASGKHSRLPVSRFPEGGDHQDARHGRFDETQTAVNAILIWPDVSEAKGKSAIRSRTFPNRPFLITHRNRNRLYFLLTVSGTKNICNSVLLFRFSIGTWEGTWYGATSRITSSSRSPTPSMCSRNSRGMWTNSASPN